MTIQELKNINGGSAAPQGLINLDDFDFGCPFPLPPEPPICFPTTEVASF